MFTRSGREYSWIQQQLASGPFRPISGDMRRLRKDLAKESYSEQAKAATDKPETAIEDKIERPVGDFRHAYDKEGRSIGGPFGLALRQKYADEEEAKRKKRLEQAGM